jgi:hypothetical protein
MKSIKTSKRVDSHIPADFYGGATSRDLLATITRALDQSPKEMELLQRLVIRALHKRFGPGTDISQHELVQALYPDVVEAANNSKEAQRAIDAILRRYAILPTTERIRLAKAGQNSLGAAILAGLLIGTAVVVVVCVYRAAKY